MPIANPLVRRTLGGALVTGLLIGGIMLVPDRVAQHQARMRNLRWDPDAALAMAGVQDALVLVRESWGSEMLARLWALGVSRPAAEHFYRAVDACKLELALADFERDRAYTVAVISRLSALSRDSSRLVPSTESPDPSLRTLPGYPYAPVCQRRLAEDAAGFMLYPPTLLARHTDVRFVRDLHARDSVLLDPEPSQVFLLRPTGPEDGAEPQFYPASIDSLRADWRRR